MLTLRHFGTKCTAAKRSTLGVKVLGIPNKRIEIFSHGKAVEYGQSYNTFKEKEKQDIINTWKSQLPKLGIKQEL
jgi:hypothetical protein